MTKNLIRHVIIAECENTADNLKSQLTISGKLPLYQILYTVVLKCTFVTDNGCQCQSANLPFYQAKLLLCRFFITKFSPLVEFAGVSNAVVTRADCTMCVTKI